MSEPLHLTDSLDNDMVGLIDLIEQPWCVECAPVYTIKDIRECMIVFRGRYGSDKACAGCGTILNNVKVDERFNYTPIDDDQN